MPIELEGLERLLTRAEVEQLIADDPIGVVYLVLALNQEVLRLKQGDHPEAPTANAPSSATPVYQKPTSASGRKQQTKRGGKPGHQGHGRSKPEHVDHTVEHTLTACPHCGGPVTPCQGKGRIRVRFIEDLPHDLGSEVTAHQIQRSYCARCGKTVEPKVAAALPGSNLGHRFVVLVSWLRFGLGVTLAHIRQVLNVHLHFQLSDGGIIDRGHRLAQILLPWYEQIAEQVKASGVLHADETGWRVLGRTHWLWCFCTKQATYYQIERSRGSPALTKFFAEALDGVLVTDFWAPYNLVECAARQVCLPHLFRELDDTSTQDQSLVWQAFRKTLVRLLRDALRLKETANLTSDAYDVKHLRLEIRLSNLILAERDSDNDNVRRIVKRLARHEGHLLTFLEYPEVPADNNLAEREIRPPVCLRKLSYGNQSDRGAATQAVLMSVFRTLKKRGCNPLDTLVDALQHYSLHGHLPSLPPTCTEKN